MATCDLSSWKTYLSYFATCWAYLYEEANRLELEYKREQLLAQLTDILREKCAPTDLGMWVAKHLLPPDSEEFYNVVEKSLIYLKKTNSNFGFLNMMCKCDGIFEDLLTSGVKNIVRLERYQSMILSYFKAKCTTIPNHLLSDDIWPGIDPKSHHEWKTIMLLYSEVKKFPMSAKSICLRIYGVTSMKTLLETFKTDVLDGLDRITVVFSGIAIDN